MEGFLNFFHFIYIFTFSFSCLIALRLWVPHWTGVLRVVILSLFLILEEMLSGFLTYCNVGYRFVCTALIILSYVLSVPSSFQTFFVYWDNHVISVLKSIYVWYYIYCFVYTESTLHLWHETSLVTVYHLLMCSWIHFEIWEVFYWGFLCLCSLRKLLYSFSFVFNHYCVSIQFWYQGKIWFTESVCQNWQYTPFFIMKQF